MKVVITGKPISVNALYRGRRFLTPEGKMTKMVNGAHARRQYKDKPLQGDLSVDVDFYFANLKMDIDNALKALFDSMTGVLWVDDRQIINLSVKKRVDKKNPRTEIQVTQ